MDWAGPGKLKFSIHVGVYKPEYGNRSIEDETKSFYEDHLRYGEKDLRYLEVDGLNGVLYQRDDETWDDQYHMYNDKSVIWNGQWSHKSDRQIVTVNMSSPREMFTQNRETLYGILQSMTFSR
jgi:hypothetical protein